MFLIKIFFLVSTLYWSTVFSADSVFVSGKYSFASNISRDEGCWHAEQNAILSATSKTVSHYLYSDKELRCLETVTGKNDCSYYHTLTSNSLRAVLSFSKKDEEIRDYGHYQVCSVYGVALIDNSTYNPNFFFSADLHFLESKEDV